MKQLIRSFHEIHNDLEEHLMKVSITPDDFDSEQCDKLKEEVFENSRLTDVDRQILITIYNRINNWSPKKTR